MKHLKHYEKYTHTPQDSIDDMTLIQEFADKFENQFEARLNITQKSNTQFRSYLGFGADKHYSGEIEIYNRNFYKTKRNIKYKIRIETDINPAGVSGDTDIDRTFVIDFDIKPDNNRYSKFPDFYSHARNMEDILEKFDDYVRFKLNIPNLSEEQKEKYFIQKTANKYNL